MYENIMKWSILGKICCCCVLAFAMYIPNSLAECFGEPLYFSQEDSPGKPGKAKLENVDKKVAVIIDDLGNGMQGTEEIMGSPIKLTVAVMPFLSTTEADARKAHEADHDVLIHLPMEPRDGSVKWLGPGAVFVKMTDEEIRKRVEAAIDNVPYAIGINNHMGSKATGDERVMSIVLDVCKERGLFFVDSRTNYRSVIFKLCEKKRMTQIKNDIFLDDVHTDAHISAQLKKVAEQVQTKGKCVTIGHVGTKGKRTAAVLKKFIPVFQEQGIRFVGISEMIDYTNNPGGGSPGAGFILP